MPQHAIIYRVLVASPSDCEEERQIIPEVIRAWNAAHSLPLGAILEPVMWETHARPEIGDRPQAIINRQIVENCDMLVGTFWTRLGTSTGAAESGTAEEIERFREEGKPVLLYFSSVPVAPGELDMAQYQSLKEYKERLSSGALYFDYGSAVQLRVLLQCHLASTMEQLHRQHSAGTAPAEPLPSGINTLGREQVDYLLEISKPRNEGTIYGDIDGQVGREVLFYQEALEAFQRLGLMKYSDGSYRLTSKGWETTDHLWALRVLEALDPARIVDDRAIASTVGLTDGQTELEEVHRHVDGLERGGLVSVTRCRAGWGVLILEDGVSHRKHWSAPI